MAKAIITLMLAIPYILGWKMGYTEDSGIVSHITFVFSHANVFHLLCNLLALWAIRGNLHIIPSLVINFAASYLPGFATLPTMGASGVLFAIVGIQWGEYFTREYFKTWLERNTDKLFSNVGKFLCYIVVPLIITIFLPNVNFALHFYTLALGMIYAFIVHILKRRAYV